MNQRLQQFLNAENISQSQLADYLGVARASISHIIAGRNKPGFDFIESMARLYPALNLEWLITGKGKMYKTAKTVDDRSDDLFAPENSNDIFRESVHHTVTSTESAAPEEPKSQPTTSVNPLGNIQEHIANQKVSKVIIFFTDGTYQELK